MRANFRDLVGQRFNRWLVISRAENDKTGSTRWLCRCDCGVTRVVFAGALRRGKSKSCGCLLLEKAHAHWSGENNPHWKGGRTISSSGYVYLSNEDYPGVSESRTRTAEHVIIMTRKLGRPLFLEESVHHKNGVRDDNRPENLELWVKPQPSGIRVEDAIAWAKEILRRYESTLNIPS